MNVHQAAATGYQQRSEAYVSARPSYHRTVVDYVVAAIGSGRCLDLGAGTGIATKMLVDREVDVVAVEPVEAMRSSLTVALPQVEALDGRSDELPLDDDAVASIVCAQTFHWFDAPDNGYASTLDELARVAQPGAALVTLWNVRDESVPWMAAYTEVVDRYAGDTPRYRTMRWRSALEDDARFALIGEVREPNPQVSSADHVVARALSTSFIAALSARDQRVVEAEMRDVVADLHDPFDFPYVSEAQIWRMAD